jgi:type II secretion system protein I
MQQNSMQRILVRNRGGSRRGLSLLEVILALSILAFSAAYLAQAMGLATENAIKAQDLTRAELVAESVMNQVIAGVLPSDPVSWTPYMAATGDSGWLYSIQNVPAEVEGMLGFSIAVKRNDLDAANPAVYDFFMNRWIIDPALGLDTPPEEEEGIDGTTTGTTGGTGAGATGSTGGDATTGGGGAMPGGFPPGGFGGGQGGGGRGGGQAGGGGGRGGGQAGGGGPGGGGPGGGGGQPGGGGGQRGGGR